MCVRDIGLLHALLGIGLQYNYPLAPVKRGYPIASNASANTLNDVARVIAGLQ